MNTKSNAFAKILRTLRTEKNLPQDKFAIKIGYSKAIISEWETGKKIPNGTALITLSNFFNVSTDFLLGLEDEFGNKIYSAGLLEIAKQLKTTPDALIEQTKGEKFDKLNNKQLDKTILKQFDKLSEEQQELFLQVLKTFNQNSK